MAPAPVFTGLYFDGKSARRRPCLLTIQDDGLLIAFTDELGPADTFWHREGIHPAEFNDANYTKLQFGPYPREVVEVEGREFYDALRAAYPGSHFTVPTHAFLSRFGWSGVFVGALVALAILGSAYVWIIPNVAEGLAAQLPRRVEHELGARMTADRLMGGLDAERTVALQGFVRHLKLDPEVPIDARVIRSDVMNAYASVGGHLRFHTALLDSITRPEQLAGLIAHEFAHAEERHSLRAIYRGAANYVVLGALFGDASGLSGLLLQQAEQMGSLAYSREQEATADATAHRILAERGLDAEGMAELFELLKREGGADGVPEWLSTHPDLDARIAAAREPHSAPAARVSVDADSLRHYFALLRKPTPQPADSSSAK